MVLHFAIDIDKILVPMLIVSFSCKVVAIVSQNKQTRSSKTINVVTAFPQFLTVYAK